MVEEATRNLLERTVLELAVKINRRQMTPSDGSFIVAEMHNGMNAPYILNCETTLSIVTVKWPPSDLIVYSWSESALDGPAAQTNQLGCGVCALLPPGGDGVSHGARAVATATSQNAFARCSHRR